jgi:hypothetical protein
MFGLPLHAAIVHIPLGVAVVVPIVMAALVVALFRRAITRRSFQVAALLQAVVVGGALVALKTGNAEEDRVEAVVGDPAIDRHERLASVFLVAAGGTLALVLAAALAPQRLTRPLAVTATAASIAALGAGVAVGHAGGELVYRHGAAAAYVGAPGGGPIVPPAEPADD